MSLTNLLTEENLKKAAKVAVPVALGIGVAYGLNESGITEWMAEKQHWNQSWGLNWGADYLVPAGRWVYNSTAGGLTALGSYFALDKLLR